MHTALRLKAFHMTQNPEKTLTELADEISGHPALPEVARILLGRLAAEVTEQRERLDLLEQTAPAV